MRSGKSVFLILTNLMHADTEKTLVKDTADSVMIYQYTDRGNYERGLYKKGKIRWKMVCYP